MTTLTQVALAILLLPLATASTTTVSTVAELRAALDGDSTTILLAAGTYEFTDHHVPAIVAARASASSTSSSYDITAYDRICAPPAVFHRDVDTVGALNSLQASHDVALCILRAVTLEAQDGPGTVTLMVTNWTSNECAPPPSPPASPPLPPGDEADSDENDSSSVDTTLCIPSCTNCRRAVTIFPSSESDEVQLIGLSIMGGATDIGDTQNTDVACRAGAGVFVASGRARVRSCEIVENRAYCGEGAGLLLKTESLTTTGVEVPPDSEPPTATSSLAPFCPFLPVALPYSNTRSGPIIHRAPTAGLAVSRVEHRRAQHRAERRRRPLRDGRLVGGHRHDLRLEHRTVLGQRLRMQPVRRTRSPAHPAPILPLAESPALRTSKALRAESLAS